MNQYYPAIFYPRLILKFIAENPIPNFKQHSHIIDSNQANLPNKETNDSNYVLNKIIRNQFFTNNNWVVIRFSEKQVVKYPYRCCKVIAQVIARVSGDFTLLSQLNNVPSLPPEPMWTIKQAKKWAKENYRRTYLP